MTSAFSAASHRAPRHPLSLGDPCASCIASRPTDAPHRRCAGRRSRGPARYELMPQPARAAVRSGSCSFGHRRLRGGAQLQETRRAAGQRLHRSSACRHLQQPRRPGERGPALRQRQRHPGRLVDLVSFRTAERAHCTVTHHQSGSQGGTGGPVGGAGKRSGAARCLLSKRRRELLREPSAPGGNDLPDAELERLPVQPLHPAGQRLLRAGRFRPQPPHGRVPAGAGRGSALPDDRHLYHPDLQCRGDGDSDRLRARADRGDPAADRAQFAHAGDREVPVGQRLCERTRPGRAGRAAGPGRRNAAAASEAGGTAARPARGSGGPLPEPGAG